MNRSVAAVVLLLCLGYSQTAEENHGSRYVLPNPKLLGCVASQCSGLWSEKSEAEDVFPKQVSIDLSRSCVYGITALYDKSIPVEAIRSTIDERYGKWAHPDFTKSSLGLWRVEPEKFAIQLSVTSKENAKKNIAEVGTKQVIYLAFGGKSACGTA